MLFTFDRNNHNLIKSITKIAFPSIVEMTLNTLVGIIDTIMISNFLGTESLVAAGFSNQLIFTIIFIFSAFNVGATSIIARSHGEKNIDKINLTAFHNLLLNIIIGFIVSILSIVFSKNLIGLYSMDALSSSLAKSYFDIVSASSVFMFITFACCAILRGVENTKTPMIIMGISNIINIVLNYVLINGAFGFPDLGINGAAIATSISRVVSAILLILILIKGKSHIKLQKKYFIIKKDILSSLWRISFPSAIEQFFMRSCMIVCGIIVSSLDIVNEAAFRIILNIESISYMPAMGLSIATATLVAKALGEKNIDKSVDTGHITIFLGIVWGLIIGLVFFIFGKQIIFCFSKDVSVIKETYKALQIAAFSQVFLTMLIITSGALRGAGDTKSVMFYTLIRLWILKVPLVYVFIKVLNTKVIGVWYSELISYAIFSIIMLRRFNSKKWSKIKF